MHWSPIPGKDSAHCLLASKSPGRTQYSQALSKAMLYLQTTEQCQLLQWAPSFPVANTGQSVPSQKEPVPSW